MKRRQLEIASLVAVVVYIALVTLPAVPGPLGVGLDASWVLGLNLAHEQGLTHGKELVWSYGPLAHLELPDPRVGNLEPALLYRFAVYGIWIGAVIRLVVVLSPYWASLWCAIVLGTVGLLDTWPVRLELPLITIALLPVADPSKWRYAHLAGLALLAGAATMVKANLGVEATGLFVCALSILALNDRPLSPRKRRTLILIGLILPATSVTLYVIFSGEIGSIVRYYRYSLEIASGYSEAMSFVGPSWQFALSVATVFALLLGLPLIAERPRALLLGLAPAAVASFFIFKLAMVRQDAHAVSFQVKMALAGLFLFLCAKAARDRRAVMLFQACSLFVGAYIATETLPALGSHFKDRLALRHAERVARQLWNWPQTRELIKNRAQTSLDTRRLDERFRREVKDGTVESVPWDVTDVRANGWEWRPRPVFQTYSAYTPVLDRLNAEHIRSDMAADFVLLRWQATDGHHPFFVDPRSYRALLERYDVALNGVHVLLMKRRSKARYGELRPLGSTTARWGEEIAVPQQESLVVMEAHTQRSLLGDLKRLLFRVHPVDIEVSYRSGETMRWRVVRPNLANGVIVDPLPIDLQELVSLLQTGPADVGRVESVRFEAAIPSEFEPTIQVRWYGLPLREQIAAKARFPRPSQESLFPLWLPRDGPPTVHGGELRSVTPQSVTVRSTSTDPQVYFDVGTLLGKYEVIVIRARFETADQISLFFGRQVDGRGLSHRVPLTERWLDVAINVGLNPYWRGEHGGKLRFDPSSQLGVGSHIDIAGVWGSVLKPPPAAPGIVFHPVPDAEVVR